MLCLLLFCIGTGLSFGLSLLVLYLQWCFSSLGQVFQACSSLGLCLSTIDIRLGVICGSFAYYATHGLAHGVSKLCTSILFGVLPSSVHLQVVDHLNLSLVVPAVPEGETRED